MSIKFTSVPPKSLYQSILSTATSFKLNDIKGWDGVDLTSADFGTQAFGAFLSADRTQLELFEWDPSTIASASITILYRGLKFDGTQTTEVTANKLDWTSGNTTVQIGSDIPQLLALLIPISYLDTDATLAANSDVKVASQKAVKSYIASLVSSILGTASNLLFGTVKVTTATSNTAVSTDDTRVPTASQALALPGTSGTPSGTNKYVTNDDTAATGISKVLRLTAGGLVTLSTLPVATSTVAGVVPTPPNNTTNFLRADATWAVPAYKSLGSWTSPITQGTAYHATTDGFVVVVVTVTAVSAVGYIAIKSDASATPTTVRANVALDTGIINRSAMTPVKNGDYVVVDYATGNVTQTTTIYWIPLS